MRIHDCVAGTSARELRDVAAAAALLRRKVISIRSRECAFAAPIFANWIGFAVAFGCMLLGRTSADREPCDDRRGKFIFVSPDRISPRPAVAALGLLVVALVAGAWRHRKFCRGTGLPSPEFEQPLIGIAQSVGNAFDAQYPHSFSASADFWKSRPLVLRDLAAILRMEKIHNFSERTAGVGVLPLSGGLRGDLPAM